MNNISLTSSLAVTQSYTSTTVANAAELSVVTTSTNENSSTRVTISSEAKDKLAQEQSAIGKELAKTIQSQKTEETEAADVSDVERLDKIIENIQEQIKEVQQQIKALNGDKTEQAQAQRKALNSQLASLNATLMGLMGKKLEAIESA